MERILPSKENPGREKTFFISRPKCSTGSLIRNLNAITCLRERLSAWYSASRQESVFLETCGAVGDFGVCSILASRTTFGSCKLTCGTFWWRLQFADGGAEMASMLSLNLARILVRMMSWMRRKLMCPRRKCHFNHSFSAGVRLLRTTTKRRNDCRSKSTLSIPPSIGKNCHCGNQEYWQSCA